MTLKLLKIFPGNLNLIIRDKNLQGHFFYHLEKALQLIFFF